MRYSEPKIVTVSSAVSAIQQQSLTTSTGKTSDIYFDQHKPNPVACTVNAYEADE